MRILIRNTTLEGEPIAGDGEVFEGKTVLNLVRAMKGSSFSPATGTSRATSTWSCATPRC